MRNRDISSGKPNLFEQTKRFFSKKSEVVDEREITIGNEIGHGVYGVVHAGKFGDRDVAIKSPLNPNDPNLASIELESLRAELRFLHECGGLTVETNLVDLGIPNKLPESLDVLVVKLGFVKLIDEAMPTGIKSEIGLVEELVKGEKLTSTSLNDGYMLNPNIPVTFQLAGILAWVKMLVELERSGYSMDNNIDTDLIFQLSAPNLENEGADCKLLYTLNLLRVDASPTVMGTTTIDVLKRMIISLYGKNSRITCVNGLADVLANDEKLLKPENWTATNLYAALQKGIKAIDWESSDWDGEQKRFERMIDKK